MSATSSDGDVTAEIARNLPYLRRYARALTGSQDSGDNYAAATLEAILADRSTLSGSVSVKVGLFRAFHTIWQGTQISAVEPADERERAAQKHLSNLTGSTREALLLSTIEEFTVAEVAGIMDLSTAEVEELIQIAHAEMAESMSGRILIIEDEPVIAMDLEQLVSDVGHQVTGIARTRDEAVTLGKSDKPDLVLADIRLADGSSGIDAVNDLLNHFGNLPVIFITAYPERLLTGERPEPAFLISKPYKEDQVRSAVSQAMFFSSSTELEV